MYASVKHTKALTYIEYGLNENLGFMVLSGEVGSGKTITIHFLAKQLSEKFKAALILNTNVDVDQLLYMILREYGLETVNKDKANLIETLNVFLVKNYSEGKRVVLIIDEAQNLSLKALEEVRMLSNLQSGSHQLLQIMLVGQPELLSMLKKPELRQLNQRVAVHYHLTALDKEETELYIKHRLKIAGASINLFTPAAADKIYEFSGGIPRLINLICQAALVYGFADEAKRISQDIIQQIKDDNLTIGIDSEPEALSGQSKNVQKLSGDSSLEARVHSLEKEIVNLKKDLSDHTKNLEPEADETESPQAGQLKQELAQERNRNARLIQEYKLLKQKYDKLLRN